MRMMCGNDFHTRRFDGLVAATQRISSETDQTGALRRVIYDTAFSVWSTNAWAWIFAFIVQTGTMAGTIAVYDTFRATAAVRVSIVIG